MPKNPGNPFTHKEKLAILRYIIVNKAFHSVKGNVLWQDMQVNFPNHTWQSLKEHYKKQLNPRLNSPAFGLSEDEINMFRLAHQPVVVSRRRARGRREDSRSPSPPTDFYSMWSDDEDAVPTRANAMESNVHVEGDSEAAKEERASAWCVTRRSKTQQNDCQPRSLKPVESLALSGSAAAVTKWPFSGKKPSGAKAGTLSSSSSCSSQYCTPCASPSFNKVTETEAVVCYDVSSGSDSEVLEVSPLEPLNVSLFFDSDETFVESDEEKA